MLRLHLGTADALPLQDGVIDGVIAVNSLQLCEPLEPAAQELARVTKPGARLVSLTHDLAAAKHAPSAEHWVRTIVLALREAGWSNATGDRGRAEEGRSILVQAER